MHILLNDRTLLIVHSDVIYPLSKFGHTWSHTAEYTYVYIN